MHLLKRHAHLLFMTRRVSFSVRRSLCDHFLVTGMEQRPVYTNHRQATTGATQRVRVCPLAVSHIGSVLGWSANREALTLCCLLLARRWAMYRYYVGMDYWVAPWEDAMILFQAVTCQITPKVPWQRALWSRVPLLDPLLFLTAKGWQGFMRQHTIGQKAQSLSSSALHNDR